MAEAFSAIVRVLRSPYPERTMDTINTLSYYFNLVIAWIGFYLTYVYDHFREFAPVIKVAAVSITITALLILFCLVRIVYRSCVRRKWNKTMKQMEDRYGEGVAYVLAEDTHPNLSRGDVIAALDMSTSDFNDKKLLKNYREKLSFCRMVYRHRISEEAALGRRRNLHVLLNLFGMQSFLEGIVNKGSVSMKVEALHMMRAFKLPISQWIANQLMASKRNRVRRLAMYASIMSSSNTDMDYFESEFFDDNCCLYDEIQLGYVLQRRRSAKRKLPNLAHWAFLQKNPATQCVFVRLMRQFDQREYCGELEELFQHNTDHELIQEIARTWGYLHYTEAEELLAQSLLTQPDDTKVAIMHALTRFATGKSLDAFVEGYKNSGDPHVRFEALRCLYNYGEAGRARLAELEASASPADFPVFAFFHNEIALAQVPLSMTDKYRSPYGDNIYTVV